jgi:pimeloyl-ACP methyl ester carboxylesterase
VSELCHREAIMNGLRFHYVGAGTGPVVLLLQGFQDFWSLWRFQIPALTAAGFHVVAPELRGYNLSAKPAGLHQCRIELPAEDIVGLVHVVGAQRTVLVGHDWGGVIGWKIAHDTPELVQKLIILNAPHPVLCRQALRTFAQL